MICASEVRDVRSPAPAPGLMTRTGMTAEPPGEVRAEASPTRATANARMTGRMDGVHAVSLTSGPRARAGTTLASPARMYEAVIIGGGPAGLNAALVLGRCRRRVLLCDSGEYRNAASRGLHAFITRDGILPAELRRLGREEIARYGVHVREGKVDDVGRGADRFTVALDGEQAESRTLLIATGVVDRVPEIAGIDDLYGRSVFHCPYCDGWEARDQPL